VTSRARALLIVLTTWALVMIVPDLYRVIDPLASFGVAVDNDGNVIDVKGPFERPSESPAERAGVRVGDRVDLAAMRCLPPWRPECHSLTALLGGLGGTQAALPGRAIDVVFKNQGGATRTAHLEAARYNASLSQRLVLLFDTLIGIGVVTTAFMLVWSKPGSMTWGFFLYSIWFNPGQTFAYYAVLPSPTAVILQGVLEAAAQGAGFAGLVVFALSFPSEATTQRWQRYRRPVLGLAAVMTLLMVATLGSLFGVPSERTASVAYAAALAVTVGVLAILIVRRRTLPPRDRQRMSWVIAGCAIGIPAFIAAEIVQSTAWSQRLFPGLDTELAGLLYLLNTALIYFVAEAVWRKRVVSVTIPLRRGTILVLLGLVVAVPFVTLHEMLEHVQEALDQPEWIWALVIAPIALLALHHLHGLAVDFADRVFNRRFHVARRQLLGAGSLMERVASEADIDRLLTTAPTQALELTSATLYRKQGQALVAAATTQAQGNPRPLTPERAALAERALDTRTFVRLPWRATVLDDNADDPCVAIPVANAVSAPMAVVLYGPHQSGSDIDVDECQMLMELANRAALGYLQVELARLRREVAELRANATEATLAS
jgi:hypothetical protein